MKILDAAATADALPWRALVDAIERTLDDHAAGRAWLPARMVLPIAGRASLFVMPAWLSADAGDIAMTKLITFVADNPARGLPAIQGDVLVLRASTGERIALADGPTITARRTAAVSALAARRLAARPDGPLLVIGAGTQAHAHVQALAEVLGVREVQVLSRSAASADRLVDAARAAGLAAQRSDDLAASLRDCPLVVTATTADRVCLAGDLRDDAFVAAIGAFTPRMVEVDAALVRRIGERGSIVIDSDDGRHEAGDLLQAGIDMAALPVLHAARARPGPVLFKSCGSALWDLAAARLLAVDA